MESKVPHRPSIWRSVSFSSQEVNLRRKGTVPPAEDSTEDMRLKKRILKDFQACKDDPRSQKEWIYSMTSPSSFGALCSYLQMELPSNVKIAYNSLLSIMIVEFMACTSHEAGNSWLHSSFFKNVKLAELWPEVYVSGTVDMKGFVGEYERSSKAPDAAVRLKGRYWPTLVMEVGWSQPYESLKEDVRLWLVGGRDISSDNQNVNLVLLVNFEEEDLELNKVSCVVELWEVDPNDTSNIIQLWRNTYAGVDITCPDVINIPFYHLLGLQFCTDHQLQSDDVWALAIRDLFKLVEDAMQVDKKIRIEAKANLADKKKRKEKVLQEESELRQSNTVKINEQRDARLKRRHSTDT